MSVASRTVFTGDNLPVLRGMEAESVDMVYADPPFSKGREFAAPIGSKAAGAMFRDAWTLNDVDVAWSGEICAMNARDTLHKSRLRYSGASLKPRRSRET